MLTAASARTSFEGPLLLRADLTGNVRQNFSDVAQNVLYKPDDISQARELCRCFCFLTPTTPTTTQPQRNRFLLRRLLSPGAAVLCHTSTSPYLRRRACSSLWTRRTN